MENDGVLFYEVNSQWWKVPVKKVKYHDEEVYDLRGAVKFEPTYLQRQFLGNDGIIDDEGWQAIIRHYRDQFGPEALEALEKDLASKDAGEAFITFASINGPALILNILFGKAADRISKIVSPTLKRVYQNIERRLEKLFKQSNKKSRQILEKDLREIAADLRDLAGRETDAAAKSEAKAIADELEEEYKTGLEQLGADAPLSHSPKGEIKGGKYRDVRRDNKGGEVHHTPAKSVSPYGKSNGPSIWMETKDHHRTDSWGYSAKAKAYRARQAELIKQGNIRGAIQMDIDDIRAKFGNKYDEQIKQMLQREGFTE